MSQDLADSWLLAVFADPTRESWGLIRGGPERQAAVGRLGSLAAAPADGPPAAAWSRAPGLELTSAGSPEHTVSTTAGAADALWLVRITGTLSGPHDDGGELFELDVPAVAVAGPRLAKLDSIRIFAAWFPDDRSIALSAVRPRGGHADKDVVSAFVTGAGVVAGDPVAPGEPEPLAIFDPLLSTTYDGRGVPLRAGVELWLGPDEDSDQRPLRVSSESTGDQLAAQLGNLHLEAYAQRCHSRGEDGIGVYALLRPR
jgi:hypothetical protein